MQQMVFYNGIKTTCDFGPHFVGLMGGLLSQVSLYIMNVMYLGEQKWKKKSFFLTILLLKEYLHPWVVLVLFNFRLTRLSELHNISSQKYILSTVYSIVNPEIINNY